MFGHEVKRDFKEPSPYKQSIETELYRRADMISHAQIVAGPDIERHVRNAREFVATTEEAKITVIERSTDVYKEQLAWAENESQIASPFWRSKIRTDDALWEPKGPYLHITHNIAFKNNDLRDLIAVDRFIDADLMGAVNGDAGDTIRYLLRLQRNTFTEQDTAYLKKAFIFTFCMRPVDEEGTIDWITKLIRDCLDSTIKVTGKEKLVVDPRTRIHTNKFKGVHVTDLDVDITKQGRLRDIALKTYNEVGSPMITGLIVYR